MKAPPTSGIPPRMSDSAVQAKTGKTWDEWFKVLDAAGAKRMTHSEIVAWLDSKHGVGSWWQQMVTVTYEQARGVREKHEKADGFEISRSKTVAVPLDRLFSAWEDQGLRQRWLSKEPIIIRKATRNKSIRMTWTDGKTSVEANFYSKGNDKSQVTAQHSKLRSATEANRMKAYWGEALDRLTATLEASRRESRR